MPGKVMSQNYTKEQLEDVLDILNAYSRVPGEQKQMLLAMMRAFICGMETQEQLTQNAVG